MLICPYEKTHPNMPSSLKCLIHKIHYDVLLSFLGQSVTNLCPFMGCLHALHFGGALHFFWLCATTSETTVTKRFILTASILGYLQWRKLFEI